MDVIWTSAAEHNLIDICDYIAADSPNAAERMDVLFHDAASRLAVFPYMGKTGQLPGTRELFPHRHYRLVYRIDADADTIWILALIHGACRWPPES